MQIYNIYDSNTSLVNRIVSTEAFAKTYCERRGYAYRLSETLQDAVDSETLKTARFEMLEKEIDFLSDCIAEMATEIYN